jgi:hypothetical protein
VSLEYPSLSLANSGDQYDLSGRLFPMVSRGDGRSRGVELFVRKTMASGVYGQLAYSRSKTEDAGLDGVMRPGTFDALHTVSAIGGYRGRVWEFSSRFTFASGTPYTPALLAESERQNRWIFDLSRINAERLPDYTRLDYRVDRHFTIGRTYTTRFVEVLNVYDHKNVARLVWNPKTRSPHEEQQLGLLPLLGVNVKF